MWTRTSSQYPNFIAQYVTENSRWASPKFILGESYGGMRSGGVAWRLLTEHNIGLNGVVLVSPFMAMADWVFWPRR